MTGKHIVITTFGSFGDLHPYLAIGAELLARGYKVTLATSAVYRDKVEGEGLNFHTVRPNLTDFGPPEELVPRIMDLRHGSEYFVREMMIPHLRESYEDLVEVTQSADLLLTHIASFAGPLVAERLGVRWVSSVLQPLSFLSVFDPPVLPHAPQLERLRVLGPGFHRTLVSLGRRTVRSWAEPVHRLRSDLGLRPTTLEPLLEGQHAPGRVLVLFSRLLAAPQPDWPPQMIQTGFPFYDKLGMETTLSPELERFLQEGPPPLVFTLGSSAVMDARDFYRESAEAARLLGMRAVLLIGMDARNRPTQPLPSGVAAFEYAPYSLLFPRVAAVAHQGGMGTTGQAMRAGKPMLIMPYSHDQPDNAARMVRLGIGRVISRNRYTASRAARELRLLLDTPDIVRKAADVGRAVQAENGTVAACDALEENLAL
jgi:UDP:flavonoid glycosyltransferase YjiC (YdhE family)